MENNKPTEANAYLVVGERRIGSKLEYCGNEFEVEEGTCNSCFFTSSEGCTMDEDVAEYFGACSFAERSDHTPACFVCKGKIKNQ